MSDLRLRVDWIRRMLSMRKISTEDRRKKICLFVDKIGKEKLKETLIEFIMNRTFCFNDILEFVGEILKIGLVISFRHIFTILILAAKIENIKKM